MSISKLLRPACVAVAALFLLHGPAGATAQTSTEAPLTAASGVLDKARPAASTKLAERRRAGRRRAGRRRAGRRRFRRGRRHFRRRFRRHRHRDGVSFYFGLPYYYPYYYYDYPGYYYRPYYRRRYGRRCDYWHRRCVANWGYANSNYYGCMKYHRCR